MRSTQPTFPSSKFLTLSLSPDTPLSSTVSLTKVRTTLSTLPTILILAPLPSTVFHTTVGAPSCTLCTPSNRAPLSTTMGDTEIRTSMYTLRANPTTIVEAAFSSTVSFTKRGTPFSSFSTPSNYTSLSTTMCFTKHGAALSSLGAALVHTAATATMGYA